MPPETPSFPSTTITWMYVLYLPTFPPHHPSFHRSCFPRQGLHASPQPTFPAREGRPAPAEERLAAGAQPLYSASQQESRKNLRGAARSPWPGQGRCRDPSGLRPLLLSLCHWGLACWWKVSSLPGCAPHPQRSSHSRIIPQPAPCSSPSCQGTGRLGGYCLGCAGLGRMGISAGLWVGTCIPLEWACVWHHRGLGEQGGLWSVGAEALL